MKNFLLLTISLLLGFACVGWAEAQTVQPLIGTVTLTWNVASCATPYLIQHKSGTSWLPVTTTTATTVTVPLPSSGSREFRVLGQCVDGTKRWSGDSRRVYVGQGNALIP